MSNMVAMNCKAAMWPIARWLCVGALVLRIGLTMAGLFGRRVCAPWQASVCALPPVLQQLLDTAIRFLYVRPALCYRASFRLAVTRETPAVGQLFPLPGE